MYSSVLFGDWSTWTELCQLLCKRPDLTLTIPVKQSHSFLFFCYYSNKIPPQRIPLLSPFFFQDLMEFLNANSTECSVVLFFTTWCQFSAGLAPHFNALPRVFPSMHFLALDASQHSRWLFMFSVINMNHLSLCFLSKKREHFFL